MSAMFFDLQCMTAIKFKPIKLQSAHILEKYLNIEGFLEKSLKIKFALKSA